MSPDEKAAAVYAFTKEDLIKALDAGVYVAMVQVGNEINKGMSYYPMWDGTWVPVKKYDKALMDAEEVLESNRRKWEKYGSGWACKCAGAYDEFSKNYGGSEWCNQAMFDFTGHPLESLKVFKYMRAQ